MTTETVNRARLTETGGAAAEGALLTCSCGPVDRPAEFVEAFGDATGGKTPDAYAPETYDATRILLAGIAAGVEDRAGMVAFVRAYDGEGLAGPIAFGDNGQIVDNPSYLYRVEDSTAVFVDRVP
jgi:branched-chain amino acid transport system substrate-binding protein